MAVAAERREALGVRLRLERRLLLGLHGLRRRTGPEHLAVGERGEFEALYRLRAEGYRLVERRWRSVHRNGDLDAIAWDGGMLAFVEVKTRTARDLKPAAAAVDDAKRLQLIAMARDYRATLPRAVREGLAWRFDVLSVYLLEDGRRVECELSRGAFS